REGERLRFSAGRNRRTRRSEKRSSQNEFQHGPPIARDRLSRSSSFFCSEANKAAIYSTKLDRRGLFSLLTVYIDKNPPVPIHNLLAEIAGLVQKRFEHRCRTPFPEGSLYCGNLGDLHSVFCRELDIFVLILPDIVIHITFGLRRGLLNGAFLIAGERIEYSL